MTRALIVDDEPLARKEVRRLLAVHPAITIVGEASNVEEAEAKVQELTPDLVFLDIEMPDGTGFDLLDRLAVVPQVVFTTAYDQHALRAFEVNALDYLLKPIEPERLAEAIARIRPPAPSSPLGAAAPLDRLFVRDGARCWFVPLAEVAVCTTEGNSTRLSWKTENPLVPRSLVALEPRLPPSFFRASRAAILNLDFVEGIDAGVGGRLHAQLRGGVEIEISRRQARAFRERCGL